MSDLCSEDTIFVQKNSKRLDLRIMSRTNWDEALLKWCILIWWIFIWCTFYIVCFIIKHSKCFNQQYPKCVSSILEDTITMVINSLWPVRDHTTSWTVIQVQMNHDCFQVRYASWEMVMVLLCMLLFIEIQPYLLNNNEEKIPPKQWFCTIFLLVFPWFIHCKTAEPCVNVVVIPAIKLHHLSDRQEWPKRSVQNSRNVVYWKELTQMAGVGGVSSDCGHHAEMMWSWGWQLPLTEGWERREAGEQVLESSCKSSPVLPTSRSLVQEQFICECKAGSLSVFLASSQSESCFPINLTVFDRFWVWGIKFFKMIATVGK